MHMWLDVCITSERLVMQRTLGVMVFAGLQSASVAAECVDKVVLWLVVPPCEQKNFIAWLPGCTCRFMLF